MYYLMVQLNANGQKYLLDLEYALNLQIVEELAEYWHHANLTLGLFKEIVAVVTQKILKLVPVRTPQIVEVLFMHICHLHL